MSRNTVNFFHLFQSTHELIQRKLTKTNETIVAVVRMLTAQAPTIDTGITIDQRLQRILFPVLVANVDSMLVHADEDETEMLDCYFSVLIMKSVYNPSLSKSVSDIFISLHQMGLLDTRTLASVFEIPDMNAEKYYQDENDRRLTSFQSHIFTADLNAHFDQDYFTKIYCYAEFFPLLESHRIIKSGNAVRLFNFSKVCFPTIYSILTLLKDIFNNNINMIPRDYFEVLFYHGMTIENICLIFYVLLHLKTFNELTVENTDLFFSKLHQVEQSSGDLNAFLTEYTSAITSFELFTEDQQTLDLLKTKKNFVLIACQAGIRLTELIALDNQTLENVLSAFTWETSALFIYLNTHEFPLLMFLSVYLSERILGLLKEIYLSLMTFFEFNERTFQKIKDQLSRELEKKDVTTESIENTLASTLSDIRSLRFFDLKPDLESALLQSKIAIHTLAECQVGISAFSTFNEDTIDYFLTTINYCNKQLIVAFHKAGIHFQLLLTDDTLQILSDIYNELSLLGVEVNFLVKYIGEDILAAIVTMQGGDTPEIQTKINVMLHEWHKKMVDFDLPWLTEAERGMLMRNKSKITQICANGFSLSTYLALPSEIQARLLVMDDALLFNLSNLVNMHGYSLAYFFRMSDSAQKIFLDKTYEAVTLDRLHFDMSALGENENLLLNNSENIFTLFVASTCSLECSNLTKMSNDCLVVFFTQVNSLIEVAEKTRKEFCAVFEKILTITNPSELNGYLRRVIDSHAPVTVSAMSFLASDSKSSDVADVTPMPVADFQVQQLV